MNIYSQISSNKMRTWVIMTFFVVFITTIVYVYGKASGYGDVFFIPALTMSIFMSVFSYFSSDKAVLAISGAKQIQKKDNPKLFRIVEKLSIGDGLPMPKIYIMEDSAINAFATGRDPKHAVVCATSGAVDRLTETELEGVIAHELSHIKNYDIRVMAIVVVLVGLVIFLYVLHVFLEYRQFVF